jgi:hypothetical protein
MSFDKIEVNPTLDDALPHARGGRRGRFHRRSGCRLLPAAKPVKK